MRSDEEQMRSHIWGSIFRIGMEDGGLMMEEGGGEGGVHAHALE
jgi:hypothetical protein